MVAWNGARSNSFRVFNGVRQGALLCPVLFCVYFDTLLISLSQAGTGCHFGSFFVSALTYADDLVLVLSDTFPLHDLFFVRMLSFVHRCLVANLH